MQIESHSGRVGGAEISNGSRWSHEGVRQGGPPTAGRSSRSCGDTGSSLSTRTAPPCGLRSRSFDQVAAGYPVARSEWVVVRSEIVRPAYVIGADGYDSAVRRMAGIEMVDHGPGQYFSIYEVEATGELPAEVHIILDPDVTSMYWPLEQGQCRWGFQIPDASEHETSMERLN